MILFFASTDYKIALRRDLCRALRQHGYLICVPGKDISVKDLCALPFTAALFCFHRSSEGLPDPLEIRADFPNIRILALGGKPRSNIWRNLPQSDLELSSPYSVEEVCDLLDHIGVRGGTDHPPICLHGLFLPSNRHAVMLGVEQASLTAAQYTLLRVLVFSRAVISAEHLAVFLRQPNRPLPMTSIPVHIHAINAHAARGGIPKLLQFRHQMGYTLVGPYGKSMPTR